MGLRYVDHMRGGRESKKLLGMLNKPCQGFNCFAKIEEYAGMAERLVRDLAIEEDLQTEITRNIRTQQSVIC